MQMAAIGDLKRNPQGVFKLGFHGVNSSWMRLLTGSAFNSLFAIADLCPDYVFN